MKQPLALALLLGWAGLTLLLSQVRWFRRQPLIDRLRPYIHGLSVARNENEDQTAIFRVLGPLAREAGGSLAKFSGVNEELGTRLQRVHSPLDVTGFRLRQLGWSIAAVVAGLLAAVTLSPPFMVSLLLVGGSPALAFLLIESQLSQRSTKWKRALILELPVVSEQLGMLLSAGYSLGAALQRLAKRSDGAVAQDLQRVVNRVTHGVDESAALREWAEIADVPAVRRLIGVLALNRDAGDLGHLITNEARAVRAEVHRDLVETIEKRGQQVWIPVTVATLVPGLLFLAVPFTEALRLFTST
jgi:tight adherence protein C